MNAIVFSVGRSFSKNDLAGFCGLEACGLRFSFMRISSGSEERCVREKARIRFIYQ